MQGSIFKRKRLRNILRKVEGKQMKKLKVLGIVIVAAVGLVGMTGCGEKKVDLNQYVEVNISGVDTKGTANIEFDYDKFEEDIVKVLDEREKKNDSLEDMFSAYDQLSKAEECFEFEVSPEKDLKNGDKVVVKAIIDEKLAEELDLKFKFKEIEEKVSGLKEATIISEKELFEDVVIEFTGVSPNAEVQIRNTSEDEYISQVQFYADKTSGLKKGDKITVTAEGNFDEEEGIILEKTEKEYTVEETDVYITSVDELSQEQMQKIMNQAKDMVEAQLSGRTCSEGFYKGDDYISSVGSADEINEISLQTSYFSSLKEGLDREWGDSYNRLDITYKFNAIKMGSFAFEEEDFTDCYISIQCDDIVMTKEGELQFDIDNMEFTDGFASFDTFYQNIITPNKERYEIEEVDLTKFQ